MKVLNKKIYRDILKNKSQFITIFIMVFLAVFAFSGVHGYMDGMITSSDEYYKNNNLQDLWVTSKNITTDNLEKIKSIEHVKDVERLTTINGNVLGSDKYTNPDNNKKLDELVIECNFIESNNINKMHVVEGEGFNKEKSGLWLDYYLARKLGIKLGDELELSIEGVTFKEKVIGLVEVPDHVYFIKDGNAIFPTHADYGFAYMSINEFPKDYIYSKMFTGNATTSVVKPNIKVEEYMVYPYAIVDVDDEADLDKVKEEIKKIDNVVMVADRNDNISYDGYKREAEEGETYSGLFSGLFVLIAILSVISTMNRFVRKERTQIGTLKALGVKKYKITWMYVCYGLFISIIASVLGVILGRILIGDFFLNMEMSYYEIPHYKTATLPIVYYVTAGIIIIITIITYLSCRKVLKEPAAEALRVERPKIKTKKSKLGKNKFANKLSLSTKWNIRDIARSKGRTLMALFGIAGCTMLVVTAIGLLNSMNSYMSWEFDKINNFEYKLNLASDYTEDDYNSIIEKYGNKTSMNLAVEFKNGDKLVTKQLSVNDADGFLVATDHDRAEMKLQNDGIYVTEKMAKIYGLHVGDEITWNTVGSENTHVSKIVGLNRDPQTQGITCTKAYFETLENEKYRADSVYTNVDLANVKEISGVETIASIENLKDSIISMLSMMYSLIALLIIISAILACVIIYNLGVLSFGEKVYQFATLKVLGFKDKFIKKVFIKQNIWITILAILIGMPLGYWTTNYIFVNGIGDTYDFNADIKITTYIIAGVGTFVVSYIVNQVLAKKVKKIDMVTSLKGNE